VDLPRHPYNKCCSNWDLLDTPQRADTQPLLRFLGHGKRVLPLPPLGFFIRTHIGMFLWPYLPLPYGFSAFPIQDKAGALRLCQGLHRGCPKKQLPVSAISFFFPPSVLPTRPLPYNGSSLCDLYD